jgi:hypothetical protein
MSKHTLWKNLSCDLTQDEISQYSQELARITGEQSEIEAQKKEVMSDFAAKLNKCTADGRVLARKIITKKEDRQVECDLEFDYKTGMVYTVRCDNGVTIDQRKLTEDERQQRLDLDGEESRRQEAEDKRNDNAAPPIIEGEILQIEHKPEEGEEPVAMVCNNSDCLKYDVGCPNGCNELEYVEECENAVVKEISAECVRCHESTQCVMCCKTCTEICNEQQFCLVEEAAEEKRQAEETENERRASICKTWTECQHKDICFTPANEEAGICFIDEPGKLPAPTTIQLTFNELMGWGYKRNEAKILAAGFQLVKYERDEKQLSVTAVDPRAGWLHLPARETWAAAERDLETMITDGMINVVGNGKAGVPGHKCMKALRAVGFEFYRNAGDRIKHGDSWKTWKKFDDSMDCSAAWETLLSTNPKALED